MTRIKEEQATTAWCWGDDIGRKPADHLQSASSWRVHCPLIPVRWKGMPQLGFALAFGALLTHFGAAHPCPLIW
jgi:hypothetical protein